MIDKKTASDLLYLFSCSLNNREIDAQKLSEFDLQQLYKLSEAHSLTAASYISLEPYLQQLSDKQLLAEWKSKTNKLVFKQLQFDMEREAIFEYLTSIGCWFLPLKGIILKDLYVNPGMREFADNDILIDENYAKELADYMVSCGYDARLDVSKDDVYYKKPFYNFEMHRSLVDDAADPKTADYYRNVKSRLIQSDDNPYEYRFTDEDFYIHMTVHEFYHYSRGGTGLKSLIDTYVYISSKAKNMNWDYINSQFDILGVSHFEAVLRSLSLKLLSYPQSLNLTDDEEHMLEYVISSGAYGTRENFIENDIKAQFGDGALTKSQKLKYFFNRIFLSRSAMKSKYPWVRRHPFLLPIGYLHRIFICGIPGIKRISKEIKNILYR